MRAVFARSLFDFLWSVLDFDWWHRSYVTNTVHKNLLKKSYVSGVYADKQRQIPDAESSSNSKSGPYVQSNTSQVNAVKTYKCTQDIVMS